MFKASPLYDANLNSKAFIRVNQGGTSSGKTYSIMQVLFTLGIKEPRSTITVVGQDVPNLKRGAFRDAQNIYADTPDLQQWYRELRGDRLYLCINGSKIEFVSYENLQDAKAGKRQYLFINEADGIDYSIYDMLYLKTYRGVFIDYNPTTRFWVHDYLKGKPNVEFIISDHRHNPFLDELTHQRIESIPDKGAFDVYARGKTGKLEGLIYPSYEIIEELPTSFKKQFYGLDFGYTNDQSALIFVGLSGGELFLDEIYYSTHMLSQQHADAMRNAGITQKDIIIADSSNKFPIDEIRARGFNVLPAKKGPGSIVPGIELLKSYKLNVTRRSKNLRLELNNYRWVKNKKGEGYINEPIGIYNHALDAVRYVVFTCMNYRQSQHTPRQNKIKLSSFNNRV